MRKKIFELNWVPDENQILEYTNLKKISDAFKDIKKPKKESDLLWWLDEIDSVNFRKWYESYSVLYTYPKVDRKLYWETKKKFDKVEKSKWDFDIMNLVEISAWRLLEKYFHDNWDNVRVRVTSKFDDFNWGVDYIIEFLETDENWKKIVWEVIWIDLTIASTISAQKLNRVETKPLDYLEFIKKREWKEFDSIPRLVLKMDRNLIYSFTNNYFTEILDKWDILDDEDITKNFDYALDDLKSKIHTSKIEEELNISILNVISDSREKAQHLTT